MKKLALVILMLFGLVFSATARQRVSFWKATTEEEKQNLLSLCQVELSVLIYMGCDIVTVGFTEDGYLIVYEDYE